MARLRAWQRKQRAEPRRAEKAAMRPAITRWALTPGCIFFSRSALGLIGSRDALCKSVCYTFAASCADCARFILCAVLGSK